MKQNVNSTLHTNATATKYYLLPTDLDLPEGDFVLRDTSDQEQQVDENAVAPYEVDEAAVKKQIKTQAGAAFDQLKESLLNSVQLSLAKARQEVTARQEAVTEQREQRASLENLLGFTIEEVKNNPQVGEAWLRSVLDGAKTVLEGSASTDLEEREAARYIMRQVRTRFEAAGISTNDTMEQLPDRLAANVFNRDPEKQAKDLNDLAAQLEQTVAKLGMALRAEAEQLKTEAGQMDNEV